MKAVKQLAIITREGLCMSAGIDVLLELEGVASDRGAVEAHEPVADGVYDAFAERRTDRVQCVAQGVASARLVRVRPQQRNQAVTGVQAAWPRDGEIGQQGEPARLRGHRRSLSAMPAHEPGSENAQRNRRVAGQPVSGKGAPK